jgi:hypothetical protein
MRAWVVLLASISGCSDPSRATPDAVIDELSVDAFSKADGCASTFGNALTDSYGRIDGTVLAVVPPNLQTCAQPNRTHLVLQVTMNGAAYRMVCNVESVLMHQVDAPLAGPAWSEGWHTDAKLDYATTLSVKSTDFVQQVDPVQVISDQIELGSHISVFATSSGGTRADSAHLVHRNATDADGAIVVFADASPHYILVRFENQVF